MQQSYCHLSVICISVLGGILLECMHFFYFLKLFFELLTPNFKEKFHLMDALYLRNEIVSWRNMTLHCETQATNENVCYGTSCLFNTFTHYIYLSV